MKTNLFLSILAVSTQVSVVAFADQATDRISGPVTCQAGDDATATISANRGDGTGEFTVVDGDGKSTKYNITKANNGDVSTYYDGVASNGKKASFGFDDQGDRITFAGKNSSSLALSLCHKGNK